MNIFIILFIIFLIKLFAIHLLNGPSAASLVWIQPTGAKSVLNRQASRQKKLGHYGKKQEQKNCWSLSANEPAQPVILSGLEHAGGDFCIIFTKISTLNNE